MATLGLILTPRRRIAVDSRQVRFDTPVWPVTTEPVTGRIYHALVFAQDPVGVIKGNGIDLFFGSGHFPGEAATRAHLRAFNPLPHLCRGFLRRTDLVGEQLQQ